MRLGQKSHRKRVHCGGWTYAAMLRRQQSPHAIHNLPKKHSLLSSTSADSSQSSRKPSACISSLVDCDYAIRWRTATSAEQRSSEQKCHKARSALTTLQKMAVKKDRPKTTCPSGCLLPSHPLRWWGTLRNTITICTALPLRVRL